MNNFRYAEQYKTRAFQSKIFHTCSVMPLLESLVNEYLLNKIVSRNRTTHGVTGCQGIILPQLQRPIFPFFLSDVLSPLLGRGGSFEDHTPVISGIQDLRSKKLTSAFLC